MGEHGNFDPLNGFEPAIRAWFAERFAQGPTDAQRLAWPEIAAGHNTLVSSPTGSGKTLAAFLPSIDRCYAEAQDAASVDRFARIDVVYVSPLKALATDIAANLEAPLRELRDFALARGVAAPEISVAVRSGDTPSRARAAMLARPPRILVTTPESLYLLVTAAKSRELLRGVRTLIVDEIHALARDKRGSHLALTLERLEALCEKAPQRIGLSATQRPLDAMARLLVGAGPERSDALGRPACRLIDVADTRPFDLAVEVPGSELGAVASSEQWGEILDRIAALASARRTTLVFVNTRRQSERLAHLLEARLAPERVAAHHGSLSLERRQRIEARLRAGELQVLVATASLELGIDVGPVELVCQVGSPRSLATALQRIGRSGRLRGSHPVGRLFPTTRDELVECAALARGIARGRLDAVRMPVAPLDILAQQIVAACASEACSESDLFALVRRAAPFAELARSDFDAVVDLLCDGIQTGHGRRAAWLARDRVHGWLRARRGARLTALSSGGAIPDLADYRVIAEPDETPVGSVNEDWAIESMAGDVFLLGSTAWKIRRVEPGTLRVVAAPGATPSVPFWLGEAPARTRELSEEVAGLRADIARWLDEEGREGAVARAQTECHATRESAAQLVSYIEASRAALGNVLPTQSELVLERCFDETGGQQLVVHAPFGGRINRAFGLALRKRICRTFDFELQAAANDDALLLSLGPQHSFPLDSLLRMLAPESLREVLEQASLQSPFFAARWRWNLSRALAVPRMRGGKRNPPALQRMQSDDLMAAVFPGLAACQENQAGPIEIPEHPLVQQTLRDCLSEAMDADGLIDLLGEIRSGRVRVHTRDTTEPSPLAHEILNGRPYTFLDDAPLEERRSRALPLRRGLPVEARDLSRLDPAAIAKVRAELAPDPRDEHELHDALLALGCAREADFRAGTRAFFETLVRTTRAFVFEIPSEPGSRFWAAVERFGDLEVLFPGLRLEVGVPCAERVTASPRSRDELVAGIARGRLEVSGPLTASELSRATGLSAADVEIALASLEASGVALRGHFEQRFACAELEWCERRALARIHAYTRDRLRAEIEPVSARDFMRFLLRWQRVLPGTRFEGRSGLAACIEQLQGFEVGAGAWESQLLAARVESYRAEWLDDLCLAGEVAWARIAPSAKTFAPDAAEEGAAAAAAPTRATRIALCLRADLAWLRALAGGDPSAAGASPSARRLHERLASRGALFRQELFAGFGSEVSDIELEAALWELVNLGLVHADAFAALRELLGSRRASAHTRHSTSARVRLRGPHRSRSAAEGRWALLPERQDDFDRDDLALAAAELLLARYGVVFGDLLAREKLALSWREILVALRRLEARGEVRGGRFVSGFAGEQFALPDAVAALRRARQQPQSGERVRLAASDPLNLVGIVLPGPRRPANSAEPIELVDGALAGIAES
jgi:ATP-dependent Lhr-like helicase